MAKSPRLIDETGRTFGLLTVIKQDGNYKRGTALWLCSCVCGATTRTAGSDLRSGKSRSCGHDKQAAFHASTRTHGASRTRLYMVWKNMKKRCADKTNKHYGGKGIAVTEEWMSFAAFQKWAFESGYTDELTIERKDIAAGYCPSNCTWIEKKHQAANRSIVAKREDGTPWAHVARNNGISNSAYQTRIHDGWSYEQASSWPMYKHRPNV